MELYGGDVVGGYEGEFFFWVVVFCWFGGWVWVVDVCGEIVGGIFLVKFFLGYGCVEGVGEVIFK